MTGKDFAPLFDTLWSAFGWSTSPGERTDRCAIFLRALSDLPTASVSHAVDEAVKREERFPKPAVLRRLAEAHLSSMRKAMEPTRSALESPESRPRCPVCGLVGPFAKALTHADGSARRYPDDHPDFPGAAMVRMTMEHHCDPTALARLSGRQAVTASVRVRDDAY